MLLPVNCPPRAQPVCQTAHSLISIHAESLCGFDHSQDVLRLALIDDRALCEDEAAVPAADGVRGILPASLFPLALDLHQPAFTHVKENAATVVAAGAGPGDTLDNAGISLLPVPWTVLGWLLHPLQRSSLC